MCVGAIVGILKMAVMLVLFINDCKSCEISNKIFFNMFLFSKTKDELVMHKCYKIKLFSGVISHSVSKEPEAYLEPCQTLNIMRERFCENS